MKRIALLLAAVAALASSTLAAAVSPQARSGPADASQKTPPAKWGALAHDPVNDEDVWFGGVGGPSATGPLGLWTFKDGQWTERKSAVPPELTAAERTAEAARRLYAAVANRYYRSETADEAKADLAGEYGKLAESVGKRQSEIPPLAAAARAVAAKLSGGPMTAETVALARRAWQAALAQADAVRVEPSPRCNASMATDDKSGTIVLFGGEGVHGVYADTWLYDCKSRTWRNAGPTAGPSPRIAAGMVARDGKVYLVGGQETRGTMSYCGSLWARLPFDVWVYDIAANTWTRLSAGEGKASPTGFQPAVAATISDDGKTLSWSADVLSYGKTVKTLTGSLPLPGGDAETSSSAVPAGTVQVRGVGFDPAWYEDVPPPDADGFAKFLADLPANRWVNVQPPKLHVMRDWGTVVLDVQRDQLVHWAGGHSSHCGTDVAHYSLATNRWHILYTPELPFEYCYSNDGSHVPTLSGSPWASHTYLSYAVDSLTGKMIWAGRHGAYRLTNPFGLWTYDPGLYQWSAPQYTVTEGRFDVERHKTCMVATPHGVVTWADKQTGSGGQSGLWLADVAGRRFTPLVATDPADRSTLPWSTFGDRHGITYDSKRDRVLLFHFGLKPESKSKIWSVDLKTKKVEILTPANSDQFPVEASLGREATYIPDADVVIVPTGAGKGVQKTLVYDCDANSWLELPDAQTVDDKGRREPVYGVSTGVEWDPKRKLLWLVPTTGAVYAMKFDRASAKLVPPTDK